MALPTAGQGTVRLAGVAVTAGQVFTPAEAATLTFTPNTGFAGTATFTFNVTDNTGRRSDASAYTTLAGATGTTYSIPVVAGTNPVAVNDAASTGLATAVTFNVTGNDTFTSPSTSINPATVDLIPGTTAIDNTLVTVAGTFTTVGVAAGSVKFTPVSNFTGVATGTYSVQDNQTLTSNAGTLSVTVSASCQASFLDNSTSFNGLTAEYYAGDISNLSAAAVNTFLARVPGQRQVDGPVNYLNGGGAWPVSASIAPGSPPQTFSARYRGSVYLKAGTYTFTVNSDDATYLFVGPDALTSNPVFPATTAPSAGAVPGSANSATSLFINNGGGHGGPRWQRHFCGGYRRPLRPANAVRASAAGHAFAGSLGPGGAVRIFTGAPVPAGADTIVIQEDTDGGEREVEIREASPPGRFIRPAGLDFRSGDALLRAGQRLDARRLALAAAMGHAHLPVRRRPLVAILATGDELVLPGEAAGPDQIVASNPYALRAIVERAGGEALDLGIARDTLPDLQRCIGAAREAGADLLVTLGGASVGDHDLVQTALARDGMELGFWRVALRPGKPLMHGRLGRTLLIGLPGNPVSSIVCGILFVAPAIRALLGDPDAGQDPSEAARLAADLPDNDGRQDYLRASLTRGADGVAEVEAQSRQDSSMLAVLAGSEALIVRPPHAPPAKAGDPCRIIRLDRFC